MGRRKENPSMELVEAASDGDGDRVRELLAKGAVAEFAMPAKYSKRPELAGLSALMAAAAEGRVDCVQELAPLGGLERSWAGRTALMLAVQSREPNSGRCVEVLLAAGANARARLPNGLTCLLAAVSDRSEEGLAKTLALAPASDLGAAKEWPTGSQGKEWQHAGSMETALMIAARDRNLARVEALAAASSPASKSASLAIAAQLESVPIVDMLLTAGAVDNVGAQGKTALMWAAKRGSAKIIEMLAGSGRSEIAAQDGQGQSALAMAAEGGFPMATKALLAAGAPPEARDEKGSTALMLAAKGGRPQCVDLLIPHGVGALDKQGRNALFYAVEGRSMELVDILLRWIDPRIKGADGRSAEACARQSAPPMHDMADRIQARALALEEADELGGLLGPGSPGFSGAARI